HGGGELALTPEVSNTQGQCINIGRELTMKLDAINRSAKMASHPWPPVAERCRRATPFSQEAIARASIPKARRGADLQTKRMAFVTVPGFPVLRLRFSANATAKIRVAPKLGSGT